MKPGLVCLRLLGKRGATLHVLIAEVALRKLVHVPFQLLITFFAGTRFKLVIGQWHQGGWAREYPQGTFQLPGKYSQNHGLNRFCAACVFFVHTVDDASFAYIRNPRQRSHIGQPQLCRSKQPNRHLTRLRDPLLFFANGCDSLATFISSFIGSYHVCRTFFCFFLFSSVSSTQAPSSVLLPTNPQHAFPSRIPATALDAGSIHFPSTIHVGILGVEDGCDTLVRVFTPWIWLM